ncbi:hypothetical protein TWF694_005311 [Orbilia ellipsospora]|uniref:Uncharacterized protein n=1 Tax=Orbilia ellipsospora TaxID=2528407 RepID=A0AAV9WSW2_9PEZI
MKFFGSTLFTFGLIASSFVSGAVIPSEKRELAPIEKRALSISAAIDIVESLTTQVKGVTATINATVAGLPASPGLLDTTLASAQIDAALIEITGLITATVTKINTAVPVKRDVIVARQATGTDLAGVIVILLTELSGTLNAVIKALGLQALLAGTLSGLVGALSALLLALVPVVDQLLALVKNLLDSLLIGLSVALAGLLV